MQSFTYTQSKTKDSIIIKLKPPFILCMAEIGNINNSITLKRGFYPLDSLETNSLDIEIKDVPFMQKCNIIYYIIGFLFLLWLLRGYFVKRKFCKNSYLEIEREGCERADRKYLQVSIFIKLIPYLNEKVMIEGIIFKASEGCSILIDKKSQSKNLIVDGERLEEDASKRDILVRNSDIIKTRNRVLTYYSRR